MLEQRTYSFVSIVLAAVLSAVPARTGWSQEPVMPGERRIGVGYVVNAPHMFAGVSGHILTSLLGGVGLYADVKFDVESLRDEPGFVEGLTSSEVEGQIGDELFREDDDWRSFNAALLRPLSPDLAVYAGAGVARREHFREYVDENGERGVLGQYWVEDEEASTNELNILVGAFFRIKSSLHLQFGLENKPRGATVGVTYALPLRGR